MTDSLRLAAGYPAARAVAPIVRAHFSKHIDDAVRRGQAVAAVPDEESIEAMIEAAFWASLRRDSRQRRGLQRQGPFEPQRHGRLVGRHERE